MKPRARPELMEAYWRFASERQLIFHRRVSGQSEPWTDDATLRAFKFCNVYRASDRVSQFLIRDVIYDEAASGIAPEDTFARVVLFRLFSRPSTWSLLEQAAGGLRRDTLHVRRLGDVLTTARQRQAIYTSAFILPSHSPFGHVEKHRNHLELVAEMFRPGALGASLGRAKSLEDVYEGLLAWPSIGPFLAYQIAVDLNYTPHLLFSENDFTMPGPGAVRGLRKVFVDFGDSNPADLIHRMVETQEESFERYGLEFQGLFGRRLHAIDCQGLFCEVDKYSREAFPNLKSSRVRIKHRFSPSPDPLPLFYPPKWGINGAASAHQGGASENRQPSLEAITEGSGSHTAQHA